MGSQNQHSPDTQSTKPLAGFPPPQHDTSPATLQAAWAEFRDIVGQEHVRTDETVRRAHAGSDWSSHNPAASDVPFCVVRPVSTDEVAQIMRVCHRRRIPVAAYSGGTSLEGHFASLPGGVCVDFARMDQIVALHPDDLDVVVQPGVGWEELNDHLAPHGLFFPPDPAPGAQIGGMVATSCSGTNAYRHGTMKEWVVGVTAVLADGTVVHTRQRPRKSSAGYDLTRLLVGSEGTLALVTQVTLKVTPAPACTRVAVCSFPSLRTAADAARRVVGAGVPVAALELLDDVQMKCINAAGSSATTRSWPEQPTLFFKFGGSPALIAEQVDTVRALARQAGARTFEFARSDAEAADLWAARKGALWAVMGQGRPADRVWTTDVAVPMSRLADLLELTRADLDASGLTASMVAHAGDGNFHAVILYADDAGAERAAVEQVVARLATRAVEMEGTVSGEHGVGLVKRDYLVQELGGDAVDLMRKVFSPSIARSLPARPLDPR